MQKSALKYQRPAGNVPLRIAFAVTQTGPDAAAGDYFTASELGAELVQRYGWRVDYLAIGAAWYDLGDVDVVVAMREDFDPRCITGAKKSLIKVAWARNWFERWCDQPWMDEFSLVLASSQLAARWMSLRLGRLVHVLRIATNLQRFSNANRPSVPDFDFVFTGSYWGTPRDVVAALGTVGDRFRGAIYGKNWESVAELAHLNRGFVPYANLPDVYRRATLVIDDANHVTKDWAAANSRVFDALAAGCLVITNSASVSAEVFGGDLPVYANPQELPQLLTHFLMDTTARSDLLARLRQRVVQEHGYAHRAVALRSLLKPRAK